MGLAESETRPDRPDQRSAVQCSRQKQSRFSTCVFESQACRQTGRQQRRRREGRVYKEAVKDTSEEKGSVQDAGRGIEWSE